MLAINLASAASMLRASDRPLGNAEHLYVNPAKGLSLHGKEPALACQFHLLLPPEDRYHSASATHKILDLKYVSAFDHLM